MLVNKLNIWKTPPPLGTFECYKPILFSGTTIIEFMFRLKFY
jgi:hypothetical protein